MTKIMIVEDDNSLREIYNIRLAAEGYEVVAAADGEEALAVAVKEKPDLILSDVMMPKISGFDMLDILRQTPETKNIRVIMMTALSSEDQRIRGEGLGADRYLVKSQVGIEDVVNAVHEVLGDKQGVPATSASPAPAQPAAPAQPNVAPASAQPNVAPVQPASPQLVSSQPSSLSPNSLPPQPAPAQPQTTQPQPAQPQPQPAPQGTPNGFPPAQ